MPRKDFIQTAFDVVRRATGETARPATPATPAKQAIRKGGLKGGATRMSNLTPGQRSELAKKAANSRWHKS